MIEREVAKAGSKIVKESSPGHPANPHPDNYVRGGSLDRKEPSKPICHRSVIKANGRTGIVVGIPTTPKP